MILYIMQGGIDMTDELQGIVNRIAATNYTNKKKRPVLCYITQNRAIKKRRIIKSGKRRPGSVHRDGYMREVSRTLLL